MVRHVAQISLYDVASVSAQNEAFGREMLVRDTEVILRPTKPLHELDAAPQVRLGRPVEAAWNR